MNVYIHPKGWHNRLPIIIPDLMYGKYAVEAAFQFTSESWYELSGNDAGDWNKLFGIDFSPFTPGNYGPTAYLAWRCNKLENCIQVGLYTHHNGIRTLPEQNGSVVNLHKDAPPAVGMVGYVYEKKMFVMSLLAKSGHKATFWSVGPERVGKISRRIYPWFGGNRPAPNRVKIMLEYL